MRDVLVHGTLQVYNTNVCASSKPVGYWPTEWACMQCAAPDSNPHVPADPRTLTDRRLLRDCNMRTFSTCSIFCRMTSLVRASYLLRFMALAISLASASGLTPRN